MQATDSRLAHYFVMDFDAPCRPEQPSTESAFSRAVLTTWIRRQLKDRYHIERDVKLPDPILQLLALGNDALDDDRGHEG